LYGLDGDGTTDVVRKRRQYQHSALPYRLPSLLTKAQTHQSLGGTQYHLPFASQQDFEAFLFHGRLKAPHKQHTLITEHSNSIEVFDDNAPGTPDRAD